MSCRVSAVMPSRAIIYEDVEQAVKHAPKTTAPMQPGIPIETQHKILGEFYEEHYRKRLPALGDRTPRHVASLKTMRPKLIALQGFRESFRNASAGPVRSPTISPGCGQSWD